jgi:hypothetical protein
MKSIFIITFLFTITGNVISDIFMPADNFYPGWSKADSLRRFNSENLYRHINGGAVLFDEFGFMELRVQRYSNQKDDLKVEVYKMKGPVSALGIYLMKKGTENPNPDIKCRNTCNPYQYIMVKGDYFILIFNSIGDTTLGSTMTKLAQELLDQIAPKEVEILDVLPIVDMVPNTQKIICGQYSLQSVYNFGPGDILTLNGKISGVSATYLTNEKQVYTVIIIPYPDPEFCHKAFENLVTKLDPSFKIIQRDSNQFVFEDSDAKYGQVTISESMMKLILNRKKNIE